MSLGIFYSMKQLAGFAILVFAALLLIVSSGTSVKSESGTIISGPIEVKKGPTIQEKANAGECPAGQAKDWAGICFPLKECKASISAQPGTCQSEEERTSGMMTAEKLELKKPVTSSNPESENCLKTETKSGESLCLTKGTITPSTTMNKEAEKPSSPSEPNCNQPAGTKNGIGSLYRGHTSGGGAFAFGGKCPLKKP